MTPLQFDTDRPDLVVLRQAIFARLRAQRDWDQLDADAATAYAKYIVLQPPRADDHRRFQLCVLEVFWQFVVEGLIAPGVNSNQSGFPWFHVTQHGRRSMEEEEYVPHDPNGYLQLLRERVQKPDDTVLAYLRESLETFARGNLVAAMIMLGIASERVFLLVCQSLLAALSDPGEQQRFDDVLRRNAMKPKVDWVHEKLRAALDLRPKLVGVPENATLMVTAIYDLIRGQRNELGHPREAPPRLSRGDSYANLLIFPRYYETAERLRAFLAQTKL